MKNILFAVLLFAGTAVMAQSGSMKAAPTAEKATTQAVSETSKGKAELQKTFGLTDAEAEKVLALQEKYCGPNAEVSKQATDKKHEAYYAALKEVVPADKAEKLMEECKMTCSPSEAKATSGKGCCAGSSAKKSCSDKK